ncbi:MAG TPA: hypothetical protein VGP64_10980 [Polyangia bacterium]
MLRLWLGLVTLARERMNAVLAAPEVPAGGPAPVETREPESAPRLTDAALGVLLDVGDLGRRVGPELFNRWTKLAGSARRLAEPVVRAANVVGWLPGVPRRAAELREWRDRGGRRIARWAAAGRRERAESRAVARAALTTIRETMLARISESPDLKRVIHEQSAGIAVNAVAELRDRSAHVDDLAEGAVGRLLGRGRARRSR